MTVSASWSTVRISVTRFIGMEMSKRSSSSTIMSMTVSESTAVPSQITVSPVIGLSATWYGASWRRISRNTSIWSSTRATLGLTRSGGLCIGAFHCRAVEMGNNVWLRRVATHFEILLGREPFRREPAVDIGEGADRERLLALLAAQCSLERREQAEVDVHRLE